MYTFAQLKALLPYVICILISLGERIAVKQDGPSMIIEEPPRAPNSQKSTNRTLCFWVVRLSVRQPLTGHFVLVISHRLQLNLDTGRSV